METKDEIVALYVGDRLLVKEVQNIDYIPREDGWQFEFVLDDYSVIGLSEEQFDRLFRHGKVSQALFARTLVERLVAKWGQTCKRIEVEGQVKTAMLVLYAVKDDEQLFDHWLRKLTGNKLSILV